MNEGHKVGTVSTKLNILGRVERAILDYADHIETAPTSYKKVFGQKIPTLWERKREFTQKLEALGELAVMVGDTEALKLIKCEAGKLKEDVKKSLDNIDSLTIPE